MNESFEELCNQLQSSNKEQCHHAIFRLCTSYPSQSAPLILDIVRDKGRGEDDRHQAHRWLLRRGGEEATMVLLPYLHDHNEDLVVRCLVARMIYSVRNKQIALPLLFECLQDESWQVRRIAAERLGTERWEDMQIVEKLVSCLQDPKLLVRVEAAGSLGKLGDTRGIETLVSNLHIPEMRFQVIRALGNRADERAIKALLSCLPDPEKGVRHQAVLSLQKVGDSRIILALLSYLQDPSWEVQIAIVEILEAWGDSQVIESLLACLESEKKWPTRKWICWALGKLGDERAIDPLIACLQDQESQILTFYSGGSFVSPSGSQVRCAAARALGKLGNQRAREPLRACLVDADEELRGEVTSALEKLNNE